MGYGHPLILFFRIIWDHMDEGGQDAIFWYH